MRPTKGNVYYNGIDIFELGSDYRDIIGYLPRIGIAQTLLNKPKIFIVDEPTIGLDPEERIKFRNSHSQLAVEQIIKLCQLI